MSVFDHLMGLELRGLKRKKKIIIKLTGAGQWPYRLAKWSILLRIKRCVAGDVVLSSQAAH